MKKIFSMLTFLTLLMSLSACKDKNECVPSVTEKEVVKEIIKEVPVEVIKEVEKEVNMYRKYKPGTYVNTVKDNDSTTLAVVIIDKYGMISAVHFDNTSQTNSYKYDEKNKKLYTYVEGIEDLIPSSYRLIDLRHFEDRPTIMDALTSDDLIVGYPDYNEKISKLIDLKTNETRQIADFLNPSNNSWSSQVNRVAEKIVLDQTTYGINLYEAGTNSLTSSVEEITIDLKNELALVQDILDNDAKLDDNTVLASPTLEVTGLYKPSTHEFMVSLPDLADGLNGIYYDVAFVSTDKDGELAGVYLDETTNFNGKSTTKWALGDDYNMKEISSLGIEWYHQVKTIEDRIITNQGIGGFTYGEGKNKDFFTNVSGVSIKGTNLIKPLKEILTSSDLNNVVLAPGIYTNLDDLGNFITIVVDKNAKISSVNLDSLALTNAMITFKGNSYPLYSYEKGVLDLELNEKKVLTYIYKDGDTFKTIPSLDNKKQEVVKFNNTSFDEEATLKEVQVVSSRKALKDRFLMDEGKSWNTEAKLYEDYIVSSNNKGLNMINEEYTDSIAGVTIKVKDYNDLLADTLKLATSKDNIAKNVLLTNFKDLGLEDYKLARGNYTFTSDIPNSEGGLYLINLMVISENEVYLSFDETLLLDGKLTTKSILGEDYKVVREDDRLVKSDQGEAYNKVIINELKKSHFNFSNALVDYEYRLDDDLKYLDNTSLVDNDLLNPFINALHKALLSALEARVSETINEAIKKMNDEDYLKDYYIVSSNGDITNNLKYKLNLTDDDLVIGHGISLKFKISEDDKVNDVEHIGKDYYITSDARKLETKQKSSFSYEFSFDDYSDVTGNVKIDTLTVRDFNKNLLNAKPKVTGRSKDVNKYLNHETSKVMSGKDFDLSIKEYSASDSILKNIPDKERLGDAKTKLYFKVNELNDVKAYLISNLVFTKGETVVELKVKYDDALLASSNFTPDAGTYNLTIGNNDYEVTFNGSSINENTDVTNPNSWSNVVSVKVGEDTLTGNAAKKLMASLFSIKSGQVLDDKSKVIVFLEEGKAKGTFKVRGFFDDYLQEKEYLRTYQKGEAYRDFTFEILSEKEVLKEVKDKTNVDHILNLIMNDMTLELTSKEDLGISDVSIRWFESLNNKEILSKSDDFKFDVKTKLDKQELVLTAIYTFDGKVDDNNGVKEGYIKVPGYNNGGNTYVNLDHIKQFRIIIEPTSPKVLDKLVFDAISSDFFTEYIDLAKVLEENLRFSDLKIKPVLGHEELEIKKVVIKDHLGHSLDSVETLYDAIIEQIGNFKSSGAKQAIFNVEVTYLINDLERVVNHEYKMNIYSNSANKVKEVPVKVEFDLGSSLDTVTSDLNKLLNDRKNKTKRYIVSEFIADKDITIASDTFEGELVLKGIATNSNVTIDLPKASLVIYGTLNDLDVTATSVSLEKESKVNDLTINEGDLLVKTGVKYDKIILGYQEEYLAFNKPVITFTDKYNENNITDNGLIRQTKVTIMGEKINN